MTKTSVDIPDNLIGKSDLDFAVVSPGENARERLSTESVSQRSIAHNNSTTGGPVNDCLEKAGLLPSVTLDFQLASNIPGRMEQNASLVSPGRCAGGDAVFDGFRTQSNLSAEQLGTGKAQGGQSSEGGNYKPEIVSEGQSEDHGEQSALKGPPFDRSMARTFADTLRPILEKWGHEHLPIDPNSREYQDAKHNFVTSFYLIREQFGKIPEYRDGMLDDPKAMAPILDKHPELKAPYEEYEAAKKKFETMVKRDAEMIERRSDELQKGIDDAADRLGIPRVEIRVSPTTIGIGGAYRQGHGELVIPIEQFGDHAGQESNLVSVLFHEMIHNEQDSKIIRMIADQLGPKTSYGPSDIEKIRKIYEDRMHVPLSPDYAKRVIGTVPPLNEEQRERASRLEQSFREIALNPHPRLVKQAIDQIDEDLRDPDTARDVLQRLSRGQIDPFLLFGQETLPEKVMKLVHDFRDGKELSRWWPDMLRDMIRDHSIEVNDDTENYSRIYRSWLHEREAWDGQNLIPTNDKHALQG